MNFNTLSINTDSAKEADERRRVKAFLDANQLSEYYEVLVSEGFDRLLCLMEITETDLISLNVKRGHRRLLQRAIATAKGIPLTTPIIINYGYRDTNYSTYDLNIRPAYTALSSPEHFYLKRKRSSPSKPIKPFDTLVHELQHNPIYSSEQAIALANLRWNQFTPTEKEIYERQALMANSDGLDT